MHNRGLLSVAVVVSGVLVVELIDGAQPHADYNVPAPTVRVLDVAPVSNVANPLMTMPVNYQTVALVREVKG
jgi:uncharacterized membrane protein